MRFLLGILILIWASNLSAGAPDIVWMRTYGRADRDGASCVLQTADGGYIAAGWKGSWAGNPAVYVVRTEANGDTLWTRTYDGACAYAIESTSDGGYIIAGKGFGARLIKIDANGDTLWTRDFPGTGDTYANSVQQTTDGGYIVIGETASVWQWTGEGDLYLIKTDENGDTLWTHRYRASYGGLSGTRNGCVRQTFDGGFIIAGSTNLYGIGQDDILLIKADSDGDSVWMRTYGAPDDDVGCSVQQTPDSGFVIAGYTKSFSTAPGDRDVYLIRVDSEGDSIWTRVYGGGGYDAAHSIRQTSDGGYIITGETNSFGTYGLNVYLIKIDAGGDTLWTNAYGDTAGEIGYYGDETADGGYVVAGMTRRCPGDPSSCTTRALLMKTSDATPPRLAIGLVHNPDLTEQADIYLLGSEPLDSASLELKIGGQPITMSVVDTMDNARVGHYELTQESRPVSVQAYAQDVFGNGASFSGAFSYTFVPSRCAGYTCSPDGRVSLRVSQGILHKDYYLVVIPLDEKSTNDPASTISVSGGKPIYLALAGSRPRGYHIGPVDALGDDIAYLEFHCSDSEFESAPTPDRLHIVSDLQGALESYVDRVKRTVSARVTQLGAFRLAVGLPGASRITDPEFLNLYQPSPNPFGGSVSIRFEIRDPQKARINVYDIRGRWITCLCNGVVYPGVQEITWDGRSTDGSGMSSGVYLIRLETGHRSSSTKVIALR